MLWLGIVIGIILGVFFAIGLTTYNIAKSNVIGNATDDNETFRGDNRLELFVKQDRSERRGRR